MDMKSQFIETFRQEAEDLLTDIQEAVLDIEQNPDDKEHINRLFRAVHTIKGSGAMFGFNAIAGFSHHVETVLEKVRGGAIPVTSELISLILLSRDQIKAMADSNGAADVSACDSIVRALKALIPEDSTNISDPGTQKKKTYRIRFCPDPDIIASGMDPGLILGELRELGECRIMAHPGAIPLLDELDPCKCFLSWDIILTTHHDISTVKDVFIFVKEDSKISIEVIDDATSKEMSEYLPRLGEILVDRGDVAPDDISRVLGTQKPIGELLVEAGVVSQYRVDSALAEQEILEKRKISTNKEGVRVPSDKLDKLINLVGELVITQARLTRAAADFRKTGLTEPVEATERLIGELRDCALNMRMLPIGTVFGKFRRLVRDLSAELGKEIELIAEGAETELDKTVIEQLSDPLVHLIRNSIDHGIRSPGEREKAGKPRKGRISLSAVHMGSRVVITVSDDGMGIDAEIIRAKGVEKGLISENADITNEEIYTLICTPGFSTATQVTGVSGRGVGMDVVKRKITSLGGTVQISTEKGEGTSVHLSMPLTLAIIDGLLVNVRERRFILPLEYVRECAEVTKSHFETTCGRNMIQFRGKLIPFIRLGEIFRIPGKQPPLEEIAITQNENFSIGIVADSIIGNIQTVIKPLGSLYRNAKGISGATIMGDGKVALIVDIPGLVNYSRRAEEKYWQTAKQADLVR